MTTFQKITLCIAGITALVIGAFIMIAPQAFFASYGIALPASPSLMSELRAPGAGLATLGAVMLAGVARPALQQTAVVAALTVFLAFPAGRVLGLVVDGRPSDGILTALVFEVVIAAMCLIAFGRGTGRSTRLHAAG